MAAFRQIGLWPMEQNNPSCWTRQHPDRENLPIVFSLDLAMAAFWRVKSFEFSNGWTGSIYTTTVAAKPDRDENGENIITELSIDSELDLMHATGYLMHVAGNTAGYNGGNLTRQTGIRITFLNDINPIFPIVSITAGIEMPYPQGAFAYRLSTELDGNAISGMQIGSTNFELFEYKIDIPMYGFTPEEAPPKFPAKYRGTVDGMTKGIILTASVAGAIGNSIQLLFDGEITIDQAVDLWNEEHEDNTVILSGDGSQIPNDGQFIQLSGGFDGNLYYEGFVRPYEFWEYNPNDGGGPIYDKYTGKQLRQFPSDY